MKDMFMIPSLARMDFISLPIAVNWKIVASTLNPGSQSVGTITTFAFLATPRELPTA
jgi:hypothetical protein